MSDSKTVQIDFGSDRLLNIASSLVDGHDYIGALKMLNKNAMITGNDEDSYMLYAEVFDDMGLYEKSLHSWFKFLDIAEFGDYSECYEGIASCYLNLGNESMSAYYYNKLMLETDGFDEELTGQLVEEFLRRDENPLKFVYPPEIADVSDVIDGGLELMKEGNFSAAAKKFAAVKEGNPSYPLARNYMAMCYIVSGKPAKAEKECLAMLEKDPEDLRALTTLAAVKTECGKREEALEIAQKLLILSIGLKDRDELYRIATVCCENKMHAEALNLFNKLDGEMRYDLSILFFKAIAAFNCDRYEDCFRAFDEIATIYPEAITAKYYAGFARQAREDGAAGELGYFYMMPQQIRETCLKIILAFMHLPKKKAEAVVRDTNFEEAVKWCFDGSEQGADELRSLAACAAVKAGMDDFVRDILLHPSLPDKLKVNILAALAERNREQSYGVVICNVFQRVTMRKLGLGRAKRRAFVRAYAHLVAHFSILNDDYGEKFAAAAEYMYGMLLSKDRLSAADDGDALTAAIYVISGVKDTGVEGDKIYSFFEVTEERLKIFGGEE